jgi:sterol desaturase/sphingolipid hydroxylase (fatty acid hydroxylase superfamily)
MPFATVFAVAVPLFIVTLIGLAVERINPVERQPLRSARFNLCYTLLSVSAHAMLAPLTSIVTVWAVNSAGGGWILLADKGLGLIPSFLCYAFTLDFLEYVFHRVQHRVPLMWAMHSLHHSDATLNASTTSRHFWAEEAIKSVTIYLTAGIIFKANLTILLMYAVLTYYNVFLHMNIRAGFGRWSVVMNSPQYHRLHHSKNPQHQNCNFAALFPVYDWVFGTYCRPQKGEFPPTGLDCGEVPSGLIDAMLWPNQARARRLKGLPLREANKTPVPIPPEGEARNAGRAAL